MHRGAGALKVKNLGKTLEIQDSFKTEIVFHYDMRFTYGTHSVRMLASLILTIIT